MSPPEGTDTLLSCNTLGLVLLGASHTMSAAEALLGDSMPSGWRLIQLGIAVGIVLLVLPAVMRLVDARRRSACATAQCDGYLLAVCSLAASLLNCDGKCASSSAQ